MKRVVLGVALACAMLLPARAAELEGVTLPDSWSVGRSELRLNGIALRTYSIFRVPIYVAGLYLVHPNHDADTILRSGEMKLLEIRFVHDVEQVNAQAAWREGFDDNCVAPCHIAPADLERFLAALPSMRKGDSFSILFTGSGAEFKANGRPIGTVPDGRFAAAMLATFIGPHPPTARLKQGLLGTQLHAKND